MKSLTTDQIVKMEFTSKDIKKICGLKRNTLHLYIQEGALKPDVYPGSGTGTTRLFSATNLVEAILITKLILDGLPRRSIVSMFKGIKRAGDRKMLNPAQDIDPVKMGFFLVFYREGKDFKHEFLLFNRQKSNITKELQALPELFHTFNMSNIFTRYSLIAMQHLQR